MRLLASVAVLCALAACTRPYDPPILESMSRQQGPINFDGLQTYVERPGARVAWVHGMCTHSEQWARERFRLVDAAFSAPVETKVVRTASPAQGVVDTFFYRQAEFRFLRWSPLTYEYKSQLTFDNSGPAELGLFPYVRASLNSQLKTVLMNDCLVDAVAYSGRAGDVIRYFMVAEVCSAIGGTWHQLRGCTSGGTPPPGPVVLVSESLGSKLLIDALRQLWSQAKGAERRRLAARLANVEAIFLISNQIPILDAADLGTPGARGLRDLGQLESLGSIFSAARSVYPSRLPRRPLKVVAFTDPNDLFSYRLKGDSLRLGEVELVNVIVSNDPTYFGFIELPHYAHCGYAWNQYVLGLLVAGYHGGPGIPKSTHVAKKECGLAG